MIGSSTRHQLRVMCIRVEYLFRGKPLGAMFGLSYDPETTKFVVSDPNTNLPRGINSRQYEGTFHGEGEGETTPWGG